MSRHSRTNPDATISHDWTGGTPDRRRCRKCGGSGIVKNDYSAQRIYFCGLESPCDACDGGTPDRRERVIIATPYPHNMEDVCKAAIATCIVARRRNGWPVHHHSAKTQTFGAAT